MARTTEQLRREAMQIWQAGVDAVRSDRLVGQNLRAVGDRLIIGDESLSLKTIRRIVVVGAGIMGRGIALSCAQGNQKVWLVDKDQVVLDQAVAQIRSDLGLFSSLGLIDRDESQIVQRITPSSSLKDACRDSQRNAAVSC